MNLPKPDMNQPALKSPESRLKQAREYQLAQRFKEALKILIELHQQYPKHEGVLLLLAECFLQSKQFSQAEQVLKAALTYYPQQARFWLLTGQVSQQLENTEAATQAYQQALVLRPDLAEARYHLTLLQIETYEFTSAIQNLQTLLKLKPRDPGILALLSQVYHDDFQLHQALHYAQQVLELIPEHAGSLINLGNIYRHLDQPEQAMAYYQKARDLSQDTSKAETNICYLQLRQGDTPEGWRHFQLLRQDKAGPYWPAEFYEWDGEVRPDKPLIIYAEQGLGDTLQMLRFAQRLQVMGQPCYLWSLQSTGLKRLVENMQPGIKVFENPQELEIPSGNVYFSYEIDLARHFGWTRHQQPEPVPYFYAQPGPEHILPQTDKALKIGLVWSSGAKKFDRSQYWSYRQRSLPFHTLLPLIHGHPELQFYSLQVGPDIQELEQCPEVIDLSPQIKDFYDTACFIQQLDLVITVDTSVAHLAGALNKALWIMLPSAPCWRWGPDKKSTTPWYPSARLFYQQNLLEWEAVIHEINAELDNWK